MKSKQFYRYYLLSCIGILIASYYPLSMGVRVITDMVVHGTVLKENYPKYIIPYTPMSIAIIMGVLFMPLCIKFFKKFAFVVGASIATSIFFVIEVLFEQKVVVSTAETVTKLKDWQMFMCYVSPEGLGETVTTYKTQTAVDILIGDYNPAFKLHFYMISVVLIITILNCLYGFGQMLKNGENKRLKSLIMQSVCSLIFLGLCILACFTAFWRDGSINVSLLSATLMTIFFVLFGITVGVFVGSFLLGKSELVSIWIPSMVASVMTLLMYIGEMILLNGHLYRFGTGAMFDSIFGIVFAPIDLFIIVASGGITALVSMLLNGYWKCSKKSARIGFIIGIVVGLVAFDVLIENGNDSSSNVGVVDASQSTYGTVQMIEKISDIEESSYLVGTTLPVTDFSIIGQLLSDKLEQEWKIYDGMTEIQRLASSKLWGCVSIQTDTWMECEQTIGFTVNNPLESFDWLNKTGYFGMESVNSNSPVKHILVNAISSLTVDRKVNEIMITAGYRVEEVRITLNATLSSTTETYTLGNICNGYATYKETTMTTGTGIPILIVTTNETNNNGYYNGDYFDPTAYWVKDNVFYTLRVFGEEANEDEIKDILYRILEEI